MILRAPQEEPLLVTGSCERNRSGRLSGPGQDKRPRGQVTPGGEPGITTANRKQREELGGEVNRESEALVQ